MSLKSFVIFLVMLLGGTFLFLAASEALEFRMTDDEIKEHFQSSKNSVSIKYTTFEGRTIRYLFVNNHQDVTVVMVHGAPGSSSAYNHLLFNNVLTADFNLVSVDRIGYGFSDFGHPETSLLKQAESLCAVIRRVKKESEIILVGHSLGGAVVGKAAAMDADLIEGLIIIAGSIDPDLEPGEWFRPLLRNSFFQHVLPTSFYVTNEEIFFLKSELEKMESDWSQIACPTIVIQGEKDSLVPHRNAEFARDHIDSAPLEIWMQPEADHFVLWNEPELIVKSFRRILEM